MEKNPLVSIIIVTHNNQEQIRDCINSVLNQQYQSFEILLVDNNSSDDTKKIIKEEFLAKFKKIKLIENTENLFYAGGNNVGFKQSGGNFIAILNPDVTVDESWLQELINSAKMNSDVGLFCSNVLLYDDKSIINACGNEMHLSGLVYSRFFGLTEGECKTETILLPSGVSFMFEKKIVQEIGESLPFQEKFFPMEFSDVDFALRVLSFGKSSVMIPSSKVFHKYKFKMDAKRFYYLEKCRYIILNHLTEPSRSLLKSSLFVTEMLMLAFALKNGFLMKKLSLIFNKPNTDSFVTKNSREKDRKIISAMTPRLPLYGVLKDNKITKKGIEKPNSFFSRQHKKILKRLAKTN